MRRRRGLPADGAGERLGGGRAPLRGGRLLRGDRLPGGRRPRLRHRGGARRRDRLRRLRRDRDRQRPRAGRRHDHAHRIDQQGVLRGDARQHGRRRRDRPDRPPPGPARLGRRHPPREGRSRDPHPRPRDPGLRPAARGHDDPAARRRSLRLQHPRRRDGRPRRQSPALRAGHGGALLELRLRPPRRRARPYRRQALCRAPARAGAGAERHGRHPLHPASRGRGPADAGPQLRRRADGLRAHPGDHRMRGRALHHRERHAEVDAVEPRPLRDGRRRDARDRPCRLALPRRPDRSPRASTRAAPRWTPWASAGSSTCPRATAR